MYSRMIIKNQANERVAPVDPGLDKRVLPRVIGPYVQFKAVLNDCAKFMLRTEVPL